MAGSGPYSHAGIDRNFIILYLPNLEHVASFSHCCKEEKNGKLTQLALKCFGQAITHIIFVHSPLVIQTQLTVRWLKKCGDIVLGRKVVEEMCLDL